MVLLLGAALGAESPTCTWDADRHACELTGCDDVATAMPVFGELIANAYCVPQVTVRLTDAPSVAMVPLFLHIARTWPATPSATASLRALVALPPPGGDDALAALWVEGDPIVRREIRYVLNGDKGHLHRVRRAARAIR